MKRVELLRDGQPAQYMQCDACSHYVRGGLSGRGWCGACEFECTQAGKRAREILARMGILPSPSQTGVQS